MQKKYQIFVSSTFNDLVEERQDTIRSVLDLGHIPAGMEIFPASDSEQFEYIKKIIDECDYYILIIGARYGSVDETGVSYTEKEYDYAQERGIPVLVFPHGDIGSIPTAKSDTDPKIVARLGAFRAKATTSRLVRFWKTRDDLRVKVLVSLAKAFDETPGLGWTRARRAADGSQSGKTSSPEPVSDELSHKGDLSLPDDTWTVAKYEMALLEAVFIDNNEMIKTIDRSYMESEHAKGDGIVLWQARNELVRIYAGKGGHFERLSELAKSNPENGEIAAALAAAYSFMNENRLAAKTWLTAAAKAKDDKKRTVWLRNATEQYAKDGDFDEAEKVIGELRSKVASVPSAEISLLRALLTVAELRNSQPEILALLERIVEVKPDDNDLRFKLAFRQSENDNPELALHHYLRIPFDDRLSGTWNNLGVLFDRFNLDTRAVDAYQRAAEMSNSLAMANLGQKYLAAGFVREAKEQCDKALGETDVSENVGALVSGISAIKESEDTKQEEVLATAKLRMNFFRSMGRAITDERPLVVPKLWHGPDCLLTAMVNGSAAELFGSFERPRNTLAGLLASHIPSEKVKHGVQYRAQFRGRALLGTVKRVQDGETILTTASADKRVYMVLDETASTISIMEFAEKSSHPVFYAIKAAEAVLEAT